MSFTPGSWRVVKDNDCYGYSVLAEDNDAVASFVDGVDARLIAAAPEMLELLKEFLWADKQFSLEFPECADDLAVFTTGAIQKTEALLKRIEEEGEET